MNNTWPTKDKDLQIAQVIKEEFAKRENTESLGLLELVVDQKEKRMNFRLANWVQTLAEHFNSMYGSTQGDFVTRQVISRCIVQGEVLH